MSWSSDASATWEAHLSHLQDGLERDADQRRTLVVRKVRTILPSVSPDRLHAAVVLSAELHQATLPWLLVELPAELDDCVVALGLEAAGEGQQLHAWMRDGETPGWLYCGEVDTLADLGRVLSDRYQGDAPPDAAYTTERTDTTADLLYRVLHALVRDVVGEVLDDRAG